MGLSISPTDAPAADAVASSNRRALLLGSGWLAAIGALLGPRAFAPPLAQASAQSEPLVGSWKQQTEREGLPPVLSFSTYGPDGVMMTTNDDPLLGPAHGAWARADDRQYDVTFERLVKGPDGAYIGTRITRLRVTVDESLDGFSVQGVREDRDFTGAVTGSGVVTGQARRIVLQPVM